MGLFRKKNQGGISNADAATLAQRSLDFIAEGVMVINRDGIIIFANPAAAAMTGYNSAQHITGLDFQLVIRLEDHQEKPIEPDQSRLYTAVHTNQRLETRDYVLFSAQSERRYAIDLACIPTGDEYADRIITFRDITTEVTEEREQADFISTASHEMRTPVASIEGYLGLTLNPQTATIDERARKYLEAAHAASQHLGRLFKDLLDVTKLDDNRANAHLIPVDAVEAVSYIVNEQAEAMQNKNLRYTFGGSKALDKKQLAQKIYMAVDYDFLREIINNLVGNAIKYTPEGGEILVAVKGEGDKVMISVADNGIGIPADDIGHVFQKFYRVDNTHTREIGGTGLGLYLVKQRVEAMGGRVWVESDFGHGSTFFVTLPRISESEYERMRIAYGNEKMMRTPFVAPVVGTVENEIKAPTNNITTAATGQAGVAIQPDTAVATQPAGATITTSSGTPTNTTTTASTNIGTTTSAITPGQTIKTTTPDQTAKPALSTMIKSHAMTLQEDTTSGTTTDPTPTITGDNAQIFARKTPTLMPKTITPAGNARIVPPEASTDSASESSTAATSAIPEAPSTPPVSPPQSPPTNSPTPTINQ